MKDGENQQLIPTAWRNTLRSIVEAFKGNNFQLIGIDGVRPISIEDAKRIARNIESYGVHLESLPDETWETSVCQWMGEYWDALIDLFTIEEGSSDLVLVVRVYEVAAGYEFVVHSVHVP